MPKPKIKAVNGSMSDVGRRANAKIILNRFTTIDKMFSILSTNQIEMSNPDKWEDKNDSLILDVYKNVKQLKALFVLCFTDDTETIYHWGAFAEKNNACCIEFDGEQLLSSLPICRSINASSITKSHMSESII